MAFLKMFGFIFCVLIATISASSLNRYRRNAVPFCSQDCRCVTNHTISLTTHHCASLNFINKLSSKESARIVSLDLSNLGLHTLDKRLKKLINLEWLNLSNNKLTDLKNFPHFSKLTHLNLRENYLKSFSAKNLPSTLVNLDVSHNFLKKLPQDITRLGSLKRIDVYGNPFSCSRESLETRDFLLENEIKIVGRVLCHDPEKFEGQFWLQVDDFDEFLKTQDMEIMQADEPAGSGDFEASGFTPLIDFSTNIAITEEEIKPVKIGQTHLTKEVNLEPKVETTESDSDFIFEIREETTESFDTDITNTQTHVVNPVLESDVNQSNLGTSIFIGIFILCLIALLIYAIKKNKERKREARRKKRNEVIKQRAMAIEMMPKNQQHKPNDKQNGNSESIPLMNGQNGSSKPSESNDLSKEEPSNQPLLEKEPTNSDNVDYSINASAPPHPTNSDVKSVKVKASEIPDSVPHTPILVTRSRSSDGNLVVTPKLNQRNS